MKVTILFLAICVTLSQQQFYHPRMMMGYPWMLSPSFAQQPMFFNNYMVNVDINKHRFLIITLRLCPS